MPHHQFKRFLRRIEETPGGVRIVPGYALPDFPQVIPDGRMPARKASQSAGVGSFPGACTRSRNNRSVSGSRSKSGISSFAGQQHGPLAVMHDDSGHARDGLGDQFIRMRLKGDYIHSAHVKKRIPPAPLQARPRLGLEGV